MCTENKNPLSKEEAAAGHRLGVMLASESYERR